MSELPFERLFAMGAFDALRTLRRQAMQGGGTDLREIISVITTTDASVSGLDFTAALALHDVVPVGSPTDIPHEFYRSCIQAVIVRRSSWARSITLGRSRFLNQLSRDEQVCFRAAALSEVPPASEVVKWWDNISSLMRQSLDGSRMERARMAEELTLVREVQRLAALGITKAPRWVAVEDNTAGYDVLSYDLGEYEPINRLIEVKSTIASPLRFFISRNEWNQALKYGETYHFHIWDLSPSVPRLFERTTTQIASHIPTDQEDGKWSTAEIPLGSI